MRHEIIEVGRGCILGGHRNGTALRLLWRGIISYANALNCRYLIGCSSLLSQDSSEGVYLYTALAKRHLAPPEWCTHPRSEYACIPMGRVTKGTKPPKLLASYLALGAKICAPPAVDKHFGTIDFLTYFDLCTLRRKI